MSSMIRNLQRKIRRNHPDYEPAPQPTVIHDDGSYHTLHPTKGWKYMSVVRLAAQKRMAALLDHVIPARRRKPPKIYRKPAKKWPSVETRQQRRHAARKSA